MNGVHSASRVNERSQEVIENKGHHFITNCNSQEVFENKAVIFCKAKRSLMHRGLSVSRHGNGLALTKIILDIRQGWPGKTQNEPKKSLIINKSSLKRTQNEPERTQARLAAFRTSLLASMHALKGGKNRAGTKPKRIQTNPGFLDSVRSDYQACFRKAWRAS